MNRIHRTVWSKARNALVAVSEVTFSQGKGAQGGSAQSGSAQRRSRQGARATSGAGSSGGSGNSTAIALSRLSHCLMAAGLVAVLPLAHALPQGGQVTAGSATIAQGTSSTTIAQTSQSASLNWSSFNVGASERVVFQQPNASAIALNRIADTSASQILGSLSANGQVFLVNPNGVMFGAGAQVSVGALVASTLDVSDSALGQASKTFSGAGTGRVTNLGTIQAAPGGYVALIANQVSNQGSIQAPGGVVALGAGAQVTLQFADNQLLGLTVDRNTLGNLADNQQLIQADGGQVILSAGARDSVLAGVVNNSGRLQARTLQDITGVVTLSGGQVQQLGTLDVSAPTSGNAGRVRVDGASVLDGGHTDASSAHAQGGQVTLNAANGLVQTSQAGVNADGATQGGHVTLQANNTFTSATLSAKGTGASAHGGILDVLATNQVALQGAHLDASGTGAASGGLIRIGGDFHGTNPGVINAATTQVNGASVLRTDGANAQGGGKVVVWSDARTAYFGAIEARGGEVEVSSRDVLQFAGDVKARQLLLDPKNITILTGAAATSAAFALVDPNPSAGRYLGRKITDFFDSAGLGVSLDPVTLQNLLANGTAVTLQANTDLTVSSPITVAGSTGGALTLQAGRSILFNANITTANGNLTAVANDPGAALSQRDAGSGNIVIASGVSLNVGTGTATLAGQVFTNNSGASALQTSGAGHWSVWSSDPASDTRGGLAYDFKQYNATYGSTALAQATGNGFLYTLAPTLTASLTGSVTKVYDTTTTTSLSGAAYSTTGVVDGDTVTLSALPANGTLNTKGVGTGKTVTATGVSVASAVNGAATVYGYALGSTSASGAIGTVTPASLAVTGINASNRAYDTTTTDALTGTAAVTALGSDVVNVTGTGAGAFVHKTVGTGKAVTVTGYTLSGTDAANYTVVQPTGLTANITQASLAVTGITATNRVYDTTTVDALSGTAAVTALGSDVVNVTGTGSGAFANKTVSTGKAVTVTGYTLGGTDAANYAVVQPTGLTANITQASLAVTGITATNRVYDTTTVDALSGTAAVTALGSDAVNVTGTGAGAFANKTVGTGKAVTVTGYTLSGTDAANYSVVQPTGLTANITQASLAVTGITANNRVYDTTTVDALSGTAAVTALGSDAVNVTGTGAGAFATKTVGTGKAVTVTGYTLSGTDAANYSVVQPTGLTANVTQASLAVTGITATNRAYDATTVDALGGTAAVAALGSDAVTVSGGTGAFATKTVGTGKAVTVTGFTLGGADAANYSVVQPTGLSANVTQASLAVTGITATNRVYDTTAVDALSGTAAVTALGSDVVNVAGTGVGAFATKTAGTGKAVTVTGYTLGGTDAGNYALVQPTGLTANITQASLSVTGVTANNRVYDTTTVDTLSGTAAVTALGSDVVNVAGTGVGAFATKTAGTGKAVTVTGYTLGGADAANYSVVQPTGLTANVTQASLAVTGITATNRVYDATTVDALGGTAAVAALGSDVVTVLGGTGAFATKTVGTGKAVTVTGFTLGGTDAANYSVVQPTGLTANVTQASLAVTGITATNRVYDTTTVDTLSGTAAVTALGSDVVNVTGTGVGTFATKTVGTAKAVTVTGFTLSGTDAANYAVVQPAGLSATITAIAPTTLPISASVSQFKSPGAAAAIPGTTTAASTSLDVTAPTGSTGSTGGPGANASSPGTTNGASTNPDVTAPTGSTSLTGSTDGPGANANGSSATTAASTSPGVTAPAATADTDTTPPTTSETIEVETSDERVIRIEGERKRQRQQQLERDRAKQRALDAAR